MFELSNYAMNLLKDAAEKSGSRFEFSEGSDHTWGITPYGKVTDPKECWEIKNSLEVLQKQGFIRELIPNGGMFELTQSGYKYAQNL